MTSDEEMNEEAEEEQEEAQSAPSKKGETIVKRPVEDEMREDYIDYAMSVIVGRALPDVRTVSSRCTGASSIPCTSWGCSTASSTGSARG